jgi:hypothetical protein
MPVRGRRGMAAADCACSGAAAAGVLAALAAGRPGGAAGARAFLLHRVGGLPPAGLLLQARAHATSLCLFALTVRKPPFVCLSLYLVHLRPVAGTWRSVGPLIKIWQGRRTVGGVVVWMCQLFGGSSLPHALFGKGLSVDPCVACCQEASVAGAAADGIGEHTGCPVCASVHARGQEHSAGEAARRGLTTSAPQAHRQVTSHLLSTGQNITSQSNSTRLANVWVLSLIYIRHTVHNLESHEVRAVRL